MPDRYGFTWPFRNGEVVCLTCNERLTGASDRVRERHFKAHLAESAKHTERRQAQQLREARRLKALAARENHKLEERGLY